MLQSEIVADMMARMHGRDVIDDRYGVSSLARAEPAR